MSASIGIGNRNGQGRRFGGRLCLGLLAIAVLSGCLGRSPNPEHFVLASDVQGEIGAAAPEAALLIGPVRLPAYLDRPQIARLARPGEVGLDEFGRWLGGFEENFLRAVSLQVARKTGSIRVSTHPSKAPFPFDAQVRLHVDDMIVVEGSRLRVRIRFALVPKATGGTPILQVFEESFPLAGRSNLAVVAAHDAALEALSRRVVDALGEAGIR